MEDGRFGEIIPLYKSKGDKRECDNHGNRTVECSEKGVGQEID